MRELGIFFQNHLGEVLVVYGLSFLFLAAAILLQPKEDSVLPFAPALRWLALFSLLHGVKEILAWWLIVYGVQALIANWIEAFLTFGAFLALYKFAGELWYYLIRPDTIKRLRFMRSLPLLAVLLSALFASTLAAIEPLRGFSNGARLFFCFPGALGAGAGLLYYLRMQREVSTALKINGSVALCAIALILYGLLTGLILAPDAAYPRYIPTQSAFQLATGYPVQFFRSLCGIALGAGVAVTLQRANIECRRREREALEQLRAANASQEERIRERTLALQQVTRELAAEIADRRATESDLRHSRQNLDHAQRVAHIGSWYLDLQQNALEWSAETYRIFGVSDSMPLSYEAFLASIHPDDRDGVEKAWQRALQGAGYDVVHRIVVADQIKWVRERAEFEFDSQGRLQAGIGTVQDITDLKNIELALLDSCATLKISEQLQKNSRLQAETEQSRMAALLSAMSVGILFEDREGNIEYINAAFRDLWAIEENFDPIGKSTAHVLEHSTHRFARPDHACKFVLKVLDTHEISERFEIDLYDGRILTQVSYPVTDAEGRIIGRLWLYEDITHERQTAQQLLYLAEHDALTGLCNRHRFQEQLEHIIIAAQRTGEKFALIYFDLDEFKCINDSFGHRSGDTVLVRVGSEISVVVRGAEIFARLGGDEFAIIGNLGQQTDVSALPARINQAVASIPFHFRGTNVRITASVGVAVFPEHGETAEDLIAHADAAMYMAKSQGKNTWAVYDPSKDVSEALVERLSWRRRIRQALDEDLFELHFQGIYAVSSHALSYIEALIRMRDPLHPECLIMPSQFITLAENNGMILEIDRWVLRRGIRLLGENPHLPPLAINISGRSFDDPGLPNFIRDCLRTAGVDAHRLIIELTETAAVSDIQDAQRFIESIHRTGCSICLDDFGSGFSMFAYLKYLDVDILKIDGTFIRDLSNHYENQVFVEAMVGIAKGLGKTILAECVEDAATLEILVGLNIDLMQGYYLGRPHADHCAFLNPSARH